MSSTTNFPANLTEIMNAPVEEVTGPRASKVKAVKMMSLPTEAAKAAKALTKRIAAEKKAHKKAHSKFKRELKATRKALTTGWKEEAAAKKELDKRVNLIFRTEEKRKKKEAKEQRKLDLLAKKAEKADKKAKRKTKAPKAIKAKLTKEQKLMKRASKAYETEMRRRVIFMKKFGEKFMDYAEFLRLDKEGNHNINPFTEEPELEDVFVC